MYYEDNHKFEMVLRIRLLKDYQKNSLKTDIERLKIDIDISFHKGDVERVAAGVVGGLGV
jgi:Zn/Cd-binding protein ZinT